MGYIPWGCKESDMTERLTHRRNLHSASLTAKGIWEMWFSIYQPLEYRKVAWEELLGENDHIQPWFPLFPCLRSAEPTNMIAY